MKKMMSLVLFAGLSIFGCGQAKTEMTSETNEQVAKAGAEMPKDAVHGHGAMSGAHEAMKVNTDVHISPEISSAWSGGIIEVKSKDGEAKRYTLKLGEASSLGNTGLTVTALAFVPDFVMDESGITSRSNEAKNPALEILVQEEGKPDYKGWLFGAMPNVHPFPHDTYSIVLVEGVPSAS